MSSFLCDNCGASGGSPDHGEWSGQPPPGWVVKQEWCSGELMSERTACSPACADAVDAKEQARRADDSAAFLERSRSGTMTLDDHIAVAYSNEIVAGTRGGHSRSG